MNYLNQNSKFFWVNKLQIEKKNEKKKKLTNKSYHSKKNKKESKTHIQAHYLNVR